MEKTVYMVMSTDVIHGGHIAIINKAKKLGKLIIGVLSDEAIAGYKRFPLIPFEERKILYKNIAGVAEVVKQNTLSYKKNLLKLKPDYVVHGDNWIHGYQEPIRQEVIDTLNTYGGKLVEFPYSDDPKYKEIDDRTRIELSLPDFRRSRLKRVLDCKGLITAMEAHSGITGLIVEKTMVEEKGGMKQFDAMWVSSLCDSTSKGKPDIELVDMTSRFRTIDDIMEVTTKPIIFEGILRIIVALSTFSIIPVIISNTLNTISNILKTITKAITSYNKTFNTSSPLIAPPKVKNGNFSYIKTDK